MVRHLRFANENTNRADISVVNALFVQVAYSCGYLRDLLYLVDIGVAPVMIRYISLLIIRDFEFRQ